MFNNLVNRHDLARLRRVVHRGQAAATLSRLRGGSQERVRRHWDEHGGGTVDQQWWTVELVRRRWATLVTGDAHTDFRTFVAERFLGDRTDLRAVSLGCGSGHREIAWAKLGKFARIDAFDVAPEQIARAREAATAEGLDDVLRFVVASVEDFPWEQDAYDVVIAEHCLHHFQPVDRVVETAVASLAPGGHIVVDDFVGPDRFQWTRRQLEAADGLLRCFPERYRRTADGQVRRAVVRPSRGWMVLTDPSEAVESSSILPALRRHADIEFERGYGGALLQLALTDISQHFVDDAPETRALLEWCFEAEDRLLEAGEVGHDFVVAVGRTKESA